MREIAITALHLQTEFDQTFLQISTKFNITNAASICLEEYCYYGCMINFVD